MQGPAVQLRYERVKEVGVDVARSKIGRDNFYLVSYQQRAHHHSRLYRETRTENLPTGSAAVARVWLWQGRLAVASVQILICVYRCVGLILRKEDGKHRMRLIW